MREAYVSFIAPLPGRIVDSMGDGARRGGDGGGKETRRGRPKRNLLLAVLRVRALLSGTLLELFINFT